MYEHFYGLTSRPFQLNPDARFYFGSTNHARAVAHLTYGLSQGDGFIVITGEVGAGKTTLIDHLLSRLDAQPYVIARIATTQLSPSALLRMILTAFGLRPRGNEKAAMLRQFSEFFQQSQAAGTRVLLIVDEVQNLPFSTLEELRMLSNLATGTGAPLQTCLVGQPQFRDIIMSAKAEQLRQRIFTSFHLGALQEGEVGAYIEHRLRVASWSGDPSFEEGVFPAIHARTDGVPRRINLLCSRLLLQSFLDESHSISRVNVEDVANEWSAEIGSSPDEGLSHQAAANRTWGPVAKVTKRLGAIERRLAQQETLLKQTWDILKQRTDVRH